MSWVRVVRSREFDGWAGRVIERAGAGDPVALATARHLLDQIEYLEALEQPPLRGEETATLKWVRQSKKNTVWRLSHPFDPLVAARLIVWFDDDANEAVLALFGGDKAQMGDVFYDSVGSRADQIIRHYKLGKNKKGGDHG